MRYLQRIGLAIVRPRAALAIAGDRKHAGRSGSDLLLAIVILLVATQLRWLVQGAWLGAAVDVGLGFRAIVHVLTRTLTLDLAFLVLAAGVIWFAGGPRRELGRAFDFACVTALPLVIVHLVAQTLADTFNMPLPLVLRWIVECLAYGWMAGLVTLAIFASRKPSEPDARTDSFGRRTGLVVGTIAACGFAVQLLWLGQHLDQVRPLMAGAQAPPLDLATIGNKGVLGKHAVLTPGKITVIDFWATWCGPCLKAMPRLDAFARKHPEIDVFAINLDDPAVARTLFDDEHWTLTLLADDGATSERYGVTAIPHTVLIDREGKLRKVGHGGGLDLEAEVGGLGP